MIDEVLCMGVGWGVETGDGCGAEKLKKIALGGIRIVLWTINHLL